MNNSLNTKLLTMSIFANKSNHRNKNWKACVSFASVYVFLLLKLSLAYQRTGDLLIIPRDKRPIRYATSEITQPLIADFFMNKYTDRNFGKNSSSQDCSHFSTTINTPQKPTIIESDGIMIAKGDGTIFKWFYNRKGIPDANEL